MKIQPQEAPKSNTIDVRATSRPSNSGLNYQPPNIKFTRQDNVDSTASAVQTKSSVSDRFKESVVGQVNALGQTWEDVLKRGRVMRSQYLGTEKESKTRSKDFMNRANAYERRAQMKKGKHHD